jgi:hypothetical protein
LGTSPGEDKGSQDAKDVEKDDPDRTSEKEVTISKAVARMPRKTLT